MARNRLSSLSGRLTAHLSSRPIERAGGTSTCLLPASDVAALVALMAADAEFAAPQWVFGMTWFGIARDGTIVATVHREGRDEHG